MAFDASSHVDSNGGEVLWCRVPLPVTKTIASKRNQLDALYRCDAGFRDRFSSDDPDNSLHGEDHPAARERPEGWHGTTVARSGRRRHMAV